MGEELLCQGVLEGGCGAVWSEGGEMEGLNNWFGHTRGVTRDLSFALFLVR